MHPILIQLGPLTIRWYGVMMATTIVLAVVFAYRYGPRFGVPTAFLERHTLPFVILAILGARIGYVLSHPAEFTRLQEIVRIDHGGLSSHGAIVAGLLTLWIFRRRWGLALWNLADTIAWAIPLGNMFVRFGNFMNGELYGDVTAVPWAVRFPGVPGLRHPLQLYEMLFGALVLILALRLARHRAFSGQIFWTVLVLTSIGRIFLDLLRSDDRVWGLVTLGDIPAVILLVAGIGFLLAHRSRQIPRRAPEESTLA